MEALADLDAEVAEVNSAINRVVAMKFRTYQRWVTRDDLKQELVLYHLDNKRMFAKWIEEKEQFRLMRALHGAAKQYAEREKAAQSGYEYGDIAWYDPVKLELLIPLALDPTWDGLTGEEEELGMPAAKSVSNEGGTLLAMVCDVRRAIADMHFSVGFFDSSTEHGQANLEWLCMKLGGEYPEAPGYSPRRNQRRRAQSTAAALYETESNY